MAIYLDDKIFYEAPIKFHDDLDALINTATHTYMLTERRESNEESLDRIKQWENHKFYTENSYKLVLTILKLIVVFAMICEICALASWSLGDSEYSIPAMIFSLMFIIIPCFFATRINTISHNQFFIEMTNRNDEFYQFRLLPDNKLYIIGGANFDENGDTLAMNYVTEMDPIYSDLIIMDSIKSISSDSEGTIIKGIATFRSYRINNGSRVYIELEKKQHMTIFIQDGIYPEEMLKTIADKYNIVI